MDDFDKKIIENSIKGRVKLYQDGRHMVEQNVILDVLFSIYQPDQIGVIDYHGPNRNYQRENITNLNMNFHNFSENKKCMLSIILKGNIIM